MKHLLSGVAIIAALAFAGPVWAQRTGPGVGAPGPNQPLPGGPGPSSPMSNSPPGSPGVSGGDDADVSRADGHYIGDAAGAPACSGVNAPPRIEGAFS
jgi:hypothetical protein